MTTTLRLFENASLAEANLHLRGLKAVWMDEDSAFVAFSDPRDLPEGNWQECSLRELANEAAYEREMAGERAEALHG